MEISFQKYQGTGNDFIMIDNRNGTFDVLSLPIASLCDRRFGIGADGLIVIENHPTLDFNMIYFNSDGSQSFCGNGSRCAVMFAKSLGIIEEETRFLSTDGEHFATVQNGLVSLQMHDVLSFTEEGDDFVINTGSPHYLSFVDNVHQLNIVNEARNIRYNETYSEKGINVNYLQNSADCLNIRTYERGVEGETLSCGTGVTAAAIALYLKENNHQTQKTTFIKTMGGNLTVSFTKTNEGFKDIFLIGPAVHTFSGVINI